MSNATNHSKQNAMPFQRINVTDIRDITVRDAYPDDLKSKTELLRLVDLSSLVPALEIIETHQSERLVRQFVTSKKKATYYSQAEIEEWGKYHGFDFVLRENIDPSYIAYVNLYDRLLSDLQKFRQIEETLGFEGEESNYEDFRKMILKTDNPLPKPGVVEPPPSERIPLEITACELQIALLRAVARDQKRELDRVTSHNDTLRKHAKEDQTCIDKLQRQLQLATASYPDLSGRRVKCTDRPFVPAVIPNIADAAETRIKGFDTILPKEALIPQLKPTPLKAVSGIYFLMNADDEIVYVGQSINVAARVGQHCIDARKHAHFTKVAAVAVPKSRLVEIERKYIAAYSPILNGTTEERINERRLSRLQTKRSRRYKKTATLGVRHSMGSSG